MMISAIFRFLFPIFLLVGAGFLLYWIWGNRAKIDIPTVPPVAQESAQEIEQETVQKEADSTLQINDQKFRIEVADTASTRKQGLMYRKSLAKNTGMLFVFPTARPYDFWMPNVNFPLDIVWISENYQVVDIKTVPPCQEVEMKNCPYYTPQGSAKYVLEVNANTFQGMIGDWVEIDIRN